MFGAALIVWPVALHPYTLPSASMQPSMPRGDYLIMMRRSFSGTPRRGDVIVFGLPATGTPFVKRLIGMPGDRVQLRGGQLFINGQAVPEKALGMGMGDLPGGLQPVKLLWETNPEGRSYRIERSPGYESAGDTAVYLVPPHCFFALGDNRDNSLDSRFDPGLEPSDPRLGGCGWNVGADNQVGDQPGVGFIAESHVLGVIVWDASRLLARHSESQ